MVNKTKGFTLIELMIVVAIIAILAALAYFNYGRYGFRTRRADGKAMLTSVASAQERNYTNFNQYAPNLAALGFTATNLACPVIGASDRCYYVISTANGVTGDTQSYILTATPGGAQANDVCGNLTLDNAGNKTPLPTAMPQNSNGNCW